MVSGHIISQNTKMIYAFFLYTKVEQFVYKIWFHHIDMITNMICLQKKIICLHNYGLQEKWFAYASNLSTEKKMICRSVYKERFVNINMNCPQKKKKVYLQKKNDFSTEKNICLQKKWFVYRKKWLVYTKMISFTNMISLIYGKMIRPYKHDLITQQWFNYRKWFGYMIWLQKHDLFTQTCSN